MDCLYFFESHDSGNIIYVIAIEIRLTNDFNQIVKSHVYAEGWRTYNS